MARARGVMREVMGRRCRLVRVGNPCRCDRFVPASQVAGLLDPARPAFARHPGVALPIAVETIRVAAAELDQAVACGRVHRSAPRFAPPGLTWSRLAAATPTLLPDGADGRRGPGSQAP